MMHSEELFMQRAIQLASLGLGHVAPNPMVGAVLVYENQIIGEGYHQTYGKEHAEVHAIQDAIRKGNMALLSKSTLYVTLEPCSHIGKTPPCADLIIAHRIPNVVIGNTDPFPLVSGRGIEKLKAAGIHVRTDVASAACAWMNRRFMTFHTKRRPYIILKFAQTADHYIAPFDDKVSKRISSPLTDVVVHRWRSEEQGILVGTTTARADNPRLNVRLWNGNNPVRMVIDKELSLPNNLHLFDQSQKTIIFNEKQKSVDGLNEYVQISFGQTMISELLQALYEKNIQSLIVEGGTNLINQFIRQQLWDEARIITSKKQFGKGIAAPVIHGEQFHKEDVGDEIIFLKPNE